MKGIIYKATNTVNGLAYIGKTRQELKKRMAQHHGLANAGSPFPFHAAIREYGKWAFRWEVIEEVETEDETGIEYFDIMAIDKALLEAECRNIKKFKTYTKKGGYNIIGGGEEADYKRDNQRPELMAVYDTGGRRAMLVQTLGEAVRHYGRSALHRRVVRWYDEDGIGVDCTRNTRFVAVKFPQGVKPPLTINIEWHRPLTREEKALKRRRESPWEMRKRELRLERRRKLL